MRRWLALGLVAITWIAFGHVLANDFIDFDDRANITENPHVLGGLTLDNIVWACTDFAGSYHPLTWISLQLDAQLFGGQAWGFHLTNLLLHTANVLLLFFILQSATGATWRAALVAALFAVHPMRVESVAWAAERKDVLSVFFWLLMIAAYFGYAKTPGVARYLLVVLAFVAGMLSKGMIVTAPFVLLLLDVWPLERVRRQRLAWLVVEKLPLLLLSFVAVYITTQSVALLHNLFDVQSRSLLQRFSTTVVAYGWYLQTTFVPVNLAIYYPYDSGRPFAVGVVATAAATLLALSAVLAWYGRRLPALVVGWLWFLGTLFPIAAFAQVGLQVWADRYVYFPHIGLFITVVWAAAALCRQACALSPRRATLIRVAALAVAGLVLAVLVGLTRLQVSRWQDAESIWLHTAAVTHDNQLAHSNLAAFYEGKGEDDLAIKHFNLAVKIGDHSRFHLSLARIYHRLDRQAEADAHVKAAYRTRPQFYDRAADAAPDSILAWLLIAAYVLLLVVPPLWSLAASGRASRPEA